MKYIRTKDGRIYEKSKAFVIKENNIEVVTLGVDGELVERTRGKPWNRGTNVVVKQANTIEELCDFIAVVSENQIYDVETNIRLYFKYEYDQVLAEAKAEYPEEHWNMYLGILTDKGLIYVAEMNEEGELCLI